MHTLHIQWHTLTPRHFIHIWNTISTELDSLVHPPTHPTHCHHTQQIHMCNRHIPDIGCPTYNILAEGHSLWICDAGISLTLLPSNLKRWQPVRSREGLLPSVMLISCLICPETDGKDTGQATVPICEGVTCPVSSLFLSTPFCLHLWLWENWPT